MPVYTRTLALGSTRVTVARRHIPALYGSPEANTLPLASRSHLGGARHMREALDPLAA